MKSITNITAIVVIEKNTNPKIMAIMDRNIFLTSTKAHLKISSKNTLESYPCAKESAHNLK